ncbi:hypothetical protein [Caballeronia sp. S22]|uniref:hypothetical protein n=1 Tax=Caballeronia sp. S22 TaxID=3137182 RepID=UPI0035316135
MWEQIVGKVTGWLPTDWRTGIAKGAVVLTLVTVSALAVCLVLLTIILAFELLLGRGVKTEYFEIPDRAIENCKILSPHVDTLTTAVRDEQNALSSLQADLNKYQADYERIYVNEQNPIGASESLSTILKDTKAQIAEHQKSLGTNVQSLKEEVDKLNKGCK